MIPYRKSFDKSPLKPLPTTTDLDVAERTPLVDGVGVYPGGVVSGGVAGRDRHCGCLPLLQLGVIATGRLIVLQGRSKFMTPVSEQAGVCVCVCILSVGSSSPVLQLTTVLQHCELPASFLSPCKSNHAH